MDRQVLGSPTNLFLSPAIKIGNIIFISGQLPFSKAGELLGGDIEEQTKQVLENIRDLLQEGGSSLGEVVKTTVLLSDISDFNAMNKVYSSFFQDKPPTRSTYEVKLAVNAKIEIEAIAILAQQ